jgi:tripartite-type tricarboxylate transporter receptor subunit TctC
LLFSCLFCHCGSLVSAFAQPIRRADQDHRPLRPGGFTDVAARILQKESRRIGQPSSSRTSRARARPSAPEVAKAAPDGYTLAMISTAHVISPHLYLDALRRG